MLAQFTHETGIRVRDETLPASSDEQHQFYAINLQAGSQAFDVLAADVVWIAEFARAGWIEDLSDVLPVSERSAFFSGPVEAATVQGRVFAVPWFIDAGLLYYRADLLDRFGFAVPETWEGLAHTASAIRARRAGIHGYVWQGRQYEGLVCNALEVMWSYGGAVLASGRVVVDSSENRDALTFMRSLIEPREITPPSVTTAMEEQSRMLFGQGRAVFLRNWPYAWDLFQRPGSPVSGRVGAAMLPHSDGFAPAPALGGWLLAVNRYSPRAAAGRRLVAFLSADTTQRALALAYGFQPTRLAPYRDARVLEAQPHLARFAEIFARARPRPVTAQYVRISQVLQGALSAAVCGSKAPADALRTAQHAVEAVLARAA